MYVSRAMFDGLASTVSCVYAPGILVLLALGHVLVSWIYFKGESLRCWMPSHFTADQSRYIQSVCGEGAALFGVEGDESTPSDFPSTRPLQMDHPYLHVYRYVAMIFFLQAVLYFLPAPIWAHLCRKCGINIDDVITLAKKALLSGNADERRAVTKEAAVYISEFTTSNLRKRHASYFVRCWYGNQLFFAKMFVLLLQTLNAIGQFYMVSCLVGKSFAVYGMQKMSYWLFKEDLGNLTHIIEDVLTGAHDNYAFPSDPSVRPEMGLQFPRVAYCYENVRRLGNVQRYTLQCHLNTSTMDEDFFLVAWFVMFVVAIVTAWCLVLFFLRSILTECRGLDLHDVIADHKLVDAPSTGDDVTDDDSNAAERKKIFTTELLRRDGLFLLERIANGAGSVMAERVLLELWRLFSDDVELYETLAAPTVWEQRVLDSAPVTECQATPSTLRYVDRNVGDTGFMLAASAEEGTASAAEGAAGDPPPTYERWVSRDKNGHPNDEAVAEAMEMKGV